MKNTDNCRALIFPVITIHLTPCWLVFADRLKLSCKPSLRITKLQTLFYYTR